MHVYKITNTVNGKIYIGKTIQGCLSRYLKQKFYDARHYVSQRSKLMSAIRKYGEDKFIIESIYGGTTNAEICAKEIELIASYRSQDDSIGYNIRAGGEGLVPVYHPAEVRAKIAENSRQMWARPGHKEAFSASQTGHAVSAETITKIKAARVAQDEAPRIAAVRKWAEEHPEEMRTRMSHEVHSLGGKSGSREAKQRAAQASIASGSIVKAQHTRWHVKRGLLNPSCLLCNELRESQ